MCLNRPLRTSVRIWLAISVPLFIAAWFLQFGKGGFWDHNGPYQPVARILWDFITADYQCDVGQMVEAVVVISLLFAIPAALVGWIAQFFVCMALDHFHGVKTEDERHTI